MSSSEIDLAALDHLVEIAKYHGLSADRQRINFEYSVGEEPLTELRFLRIAHDLGLEVSAKRLSWRKLRGLGQAYPVLLVLKSGETFLLSGFEVDEETGAEYVLAVRKDGIRPVSPLCR